VQLPLQLYRVQALDLMHALLTTGASPRARRLRSGLRAQARASAAALQDAANVPAISANPGANAITLGAGAVDMSNRAGSAWQNGPHH
jgi:hydroxybutyrate-dimer hydrolase